VSLGNEQTMVDIFLSYARSDRERAIQFVNAFEGRGWSVWWDGRLGAGDKFRDVIDEKLKIAKCVVVLWSASSVSREFPIGEAEAAQQRDILIPVLIDRVKQPLGFGERQAADLSNWDGSASAPSFQKLLNDIGDRIGAAPVKAADAAAPSLGDRFPRRNWDFTGREPNLTSLHAALTAQQPDAQVHAVVGFEGVGKTQLVIEYAHRYSEAYRLVWWLPASEPDALRHSYSELANELGLRELDGRNPAPPLDLVRKWLGRNQGWLLIFDDARVAGDIERYLPSRLTGRVVVTSTNQDWQLGIVTPLPLFERDEAADFLLRRAKRGRDEEAAAHDLAEWLGRLPLALEQGAAYVVARQISFAEALEIFRLDAMRLLKAPVRAADQSSTLWAMWQRAFDEATTESQAAADVLNLCAFFAPEDIPRWLLDRGQSAARADRHDAIAPLRRYGLVHATLDIVSVHSLFQEFLREQLADVDAQGYAARVLALIEEAFPDDPSDVKTWKQCGLLLLHASTALAHGEARGTDIDVRVRLLDRLGVYLQAQGLFAAADERFRDALQILEKIGERGPLTATVRRHVGTLLLESGDIDAAQRCLEEALQVHSDRCGAESVEVADDKVSLAAVVVEHGDLPRATDLLEHALAIHSERQGHAHLSVARDLTDLAVVHLRSGNLLKAQVEIAQALAAYEAVQQGGHPNARFLQFLGSSLSADDDPASSPVGRFADILAATVGCV
jgi:tetratricopeptide (TPR) repeat protein